jgi:lactoylglutathione lyase
LASIVGIAHVGIRVRDMDRSRALDESVVFEFVVGPEPVAIMTHPSGVEINLILNARESEAPNILMDVPEKHPSYRHIALAVDNLTAMQAKLEDAGIALSGGPITFWEGNSSIFVRTP